MSKYVLEKEDGSRVAYNLLAFAIEDAIKTVGRAAITDYVSKCIWRFVDGHLIGKDSLS